MVIKTFDWEKDTLFGYEEGRHLFLVESLREGIRAGDKIKPFDIFHIEGNNYMINYDKTSKNNGGHHRAIASYKERRNPLVNLLDVAEDKKKFLQGDMFPIDKIVLFDYRNIYYEDLRKYYENDFWIRAKEYTRINYKKYGLIPPERFM
ncbi:MAG: hypothetical protein PF542_03595 [Nanoarchaeota archaeon]|jgi:hypothetical protein|nr:hypothetical protein [Nanoarchaeota archaeon]